MKKILSLLMLVVMTMPGAMGANEKSDCEIVAGMNVATFDNSNASSRIGFQLGIRTTLGLPKVAQGLYGNLGAMLSLRGGQAASVTFNPFYLDIPIHLGYKHQVSRDGDVALFGEFGPYFGVGLFGTTEGEDVFGDIVGMNRFDMGLGLRAGVEFNRKVSASLGYDFGLVDVADDVKLKNRNFYVALGYKF